MTQSYCTTSQFGNLGKIEAKTCREDGASVWVRFDTRGGFSLALTIEDAEKLVAGLPAEIAGAKAIRAAWAAAKAA